MSQIHFWKDMEDEQRKNTHSVLRPPALQGEPAIFQFTGGGKGAPMNWGGGWGARASLCKRTSSQQRLEKKTLLNINTVHLTEQTNCSPNPGWLHSRVYLCPTLHGSRAADRKLGQAWEKGEQRASLGFYL